MFLSIWHCLVKWKGASSLSLCCGPALVVNAYPQTLRKDVCHSIMKTQLQTGDETHTLAEEPLSKPAWMSLLAIEVAVCGEERNQADVLIDVLMTRGCVFRNCCASSCLNSVATPPYTWKLHVDVTRVDPIRVPVWSYTALLALHGHPWRADNRRPWLFN